MTSDEVTFTLWGAWLASWMVGRFWSNLTEKRDRIWIEIAFRGFFCAGLILIFAIPAGSDYDARMRLWKIGDPADWILVVLTAAGLLFTWWSRIHLGPLWSELVVRKAGHHVVETGPIDWCAIRFIRA